MGCDFSKKKPEADALGLDTEFQLVSGNNVYKLNTDSCDKLTKEECALVKKTWAVIKADLTMNGLQVFLMFFEKEPNAMKLFGIENVPLKEVPKNATMQRHIPRFMGALDEAVSCIQEEPHVMNRFDSVLIDIGRRHKRHYTFKAAYFDGLRESFMKQWDRSIGAEFTDNAQKAWATVFERIMLKLNEGYAIKE